MRLQAIATTLGDAAPHPAATSPSGCVADKYQDRFLDEYWAAWIRTAAARRSRRGHAAGMRLELQVNGRPVVHEIEPQELLLDVLRDRLGLTGAKRSCDMQVMWGLHRAGGRATGFVLLLPRGGCRGPTTC